jgi:site-specific recombinase XerD
VAAAFDEDSVQASRGEALHLLWFRHLTASILAQEGVDIPTIRAILRHKNSMTTTRYIHRLGITKNVLEDVFG